MTRKEVRAILGEPARSEAVGVATERAASDYALAPMERWFFEYTIVEDRPHPSAGTAAIGRGEHLYGNVEFVPPDGTVSSWTEPDWSLAIGA